MIAFTLTIPREAKCETNEPIMGLLLARTVSTVSLQGVVSFTLCWDILLLKLFFFVRWRCGYFALGWLHLRKNKLGRLGSNWLPGRSSIELKYKRTNLVVTPNYFATKLTIWG